MNWPALALKLALVDPEAAVTDAGTVTVFKSDFRAIVNPPAGAALDKVTVQVVLPLGASEVTLHCSEERVTAAISEIVVGLEELLTEAVTVAV